MSLGIALRASNATMMAPSAHQAASPTPAGAGGHEAKPAASTSTLPTKLHFFPLPRAPVWRRVTMTGGVLPPPSAGHSLTLLNHGTALLLFGGTHTPPASTGSAMVQPTPEFYLLDTKSTSACRVLVGGPRLGVEQSHSIRVGHSAVKLSEHAALINGGWNGAKMVTSGVVVDLQTMTMLFEHNNTRPAHATATSILDARPPRTMPPPRRDHSLIQLNSRTVLLFGGWDGEEALNDMWLCELTRTPTGKSWVWQPYACGGTPSPRRGATIVRAGARVWLFGGLEGFSTYRNDLHVLDMATGAWSAAPSTSFAGQPPSPRAWAASAVVGDFVLIWGGAGPNGGFLNDLHLLDTQGRRWYQLIQTGASPSAASSPSPRAAAAVALVGSTLYVHGGFVCHETRSTDAFAVTSGLNAPVKHVLPCDELWALETHLPVPEYDEDDDDLSEDDDAEPVPGRPKAINVAEPFSAPALITPVSTSFSHSSSSATAAAAAMAAAATPNASINVPSTAASSPSSVSKASSPKRSAAPNAIASVTDSGAIEGWLAYAHAGLPSPAVSSSALPSSQQTGPVSSTPGGGVLPSRNSSSPTPVSTSSASLSGVPPSRWSRRLVRLEKHAVTVYQPEERATMQLAEGSLQEWVDVHRSAVAVGPTDAIETWIASTVAGQSMSLPPGLATPSIFHSGGSSLLAEASAAADRPQSATREATQHDALLTRLLSVDDVLHASFLGWLAKEPGGKEELMKMVEGIDLLKGNTAIATDKAAWADLLIKKLAPGTPAAGLVPAGVLVESRSALSKVPVGGLDKLRTACRAVLLPTVSKWLGSMGSTGAPRSARGSLAPMSWKAGLSGGGVGAASKASTPTAAAAATVGPPPRLALKESLDESDRDIPFCAHCLMKFSSRTTKHRSFCEYCFDVCCDRCVMNQVPLPTELQRLIAGSDTGNGARTVQTVARLRVCHMCEYVLTARSRLETPGARAAPMMYAFSFSALERKHAPVHLAADSHQAMREWMTAIGECVRGDAASALTSASEDASKASPEKAPRPLLPSAFSLSSPSSTINPNVHKEGFLLKEDGENSKSFKRHYCVLNGAAGTLTFFDAPIKRAVKLSHQSIVREEKEQVNISASGWGSGHVGGEKTTTAAAAAEREDPNRWPTVYPFVVIENGRDAGSGLTSASVTLAAPTADERALWINTIARDIKSCEPASSAAPAVFSPLLVGSCSVLERPESGRTRSVSTPSLSASGLTAASALVHSSTPGLHTRAASGVGGGSVGLAATTPSATDSPVRFANSLPTGQASLHGASGANFQLDKVDEDA